MELCPVFFVFAVFRYGCLHIFLPVDCGKVTFATRADSCCVGLIGFVEGEITGWAKRKAEKRRVGICMVRKKKGAFFRRGGRGEIELPDA